MPASKKIAYNKDLLTDMADVMKCVWEHYGEAQRKRVRATMVKDLMALCCYVTCAHYDAGYITKAEAAQASAVIISDVIETVMPEIAEEFTPTAVTDLILQVISKKGMA